MHERCSQTRSANGKSKIISILKESKEWNESLLANVMCFVSWKASLVRDSMAPTACPCSGHQVELGIRIGAGHCFTGGLVVKIGGLVAGR